MSKSILEKIRNSSVATKIGLGALGGATVTGVGAGVYYAVQDPEMQTLNVEKEGEFQNPATQTFAINSDEDFQKMYEATLPLVQMSLFATEVLVQNPYADNGKVINTIGLGSYWYPEDGNPCSAGKWVHSSKYFAKHSGIKISAEKALELVDGWFRYRENGRVYNNMKDLLKGTTLTAHEFAAICGCMYNNEAHGRDFCRFVKRNHDKPLECVKELIGYSKKVKKEFVDGIFKRHTFEALLYLNWNNCANRLHTLKVKQGVNSKNKTYYTTSITQLNNRECPEVLTQMKKGNYDALYNVGNKIFNYVGEGAKTIYEIICSKVEDNKAREDMIAYCLNTTDKIDEISGEVINTQDSLPRVNADFQGERSKLLYKTAVNCGKKGDYQEAINNFQKIIDNGYDGADVRREMAHAYFSLGDYDNCVKQCAAVLHTGEREQYAAANYLAGQAYEKLGNKDRALTNYRIAAQRDTANVVYSETYEKAKVNLGQHKSKATGNSKKSQLKTKEKTH